MDIRKLPWAALPQAMVVPVALLASAGLVLHASAGAFSATTSNPVDTWATGQVVLTDDDGGNSPTTGTAMFTATNLKPGSTGQKCITVQSTSTLPANMRLYTQASSTTNGLATHIDLTIEEGTGGSTSSFATCTGFTAASTFYTGTLANLTASQTSFATGIGSTALTGTPTEARRYRFTYTVNAATPNTAQSGTAQTTIVWEAQGT